MGQTNNTYINIIVGTLIKNNNLKIDSVQYYSNKSSMI